MGLFDTPQSSLDLSYSVQAQALFASLAGAVPSGRLAGLAFETYLANNSVWNAKDMGMDSAYTSQSNTTALNKAIKDCSTAGGGMVYVPPGEYEVDPILDPSESYATYGGPMVRSNVHLFMASGAVLTAPAQDEPIYCLLQVKAGATNVKISGGRLVGDRQTHTGSDGQHGQGILVRGACDGVTISDVSCEEMWGDGICLQPSDSGDPTTRPRNVTIINPRLFNCRRQGLTLAGAVGVRVFGAWIWGIDGHDPQFGIDFEPDNVATGNEDVLIVGARVWDCTGGAVIMAGQPEAGPNTDIRFVGCYFESLGADSFAYDGPRTNDATFIACTFVGRTRSLKNADFTDCRFYCNMAGEYCIDSQGDWYTRFHNCRVYATNGARPFLLLGSTNFQRAKESHNTHYVQEGNDAVDGAFMAAFSGHVLFSGGSYTHDGDSPATGYNISHVLSNFTRFKDFYVSGIVGGQLVTGSGVVNYDAYSGLATQGSIRENSFGSDLGDNDATLAWFSDHPNQLWETTFTSDHTATLTTANAFSGAWFRLVRQSAGAFDLDVGPGLCVLAEKEWCDVEFNGTIWRVTAGGPVPS